MNPQFDAENPGITQARKRRADLALKGGDLSPAEQKEYDRLQSFISGVPQSSGGTGVKDIFEGQGNILDKVNAYDERKMALSNKYRTIEGATQGAIDEQANRRILTDGSVKERLQNNNATLTEQAKTNDARRALINYKSN